MNYDKVLKPVTRAAESLQRDKDMKRQFSGVIKLIDKLESATDEVAKFKSVVDEKSYDEKVKLLTNLTKACDSAITELTRESKLKEKEDAKAKKDSSKNQNPKKAKDESDNPALEALASSLDDFKAQADKDLKSLDKWFSAESKKDTLEIKVPRDVTDMIELVDAKGRIELPGDQSFDATITLTFQDAPNIGEELKKNGREFIGEIGRALAPIKQDVARAFKAWNSEFAEIEESFDKPAADKLFKDINDWFLQKLPKLAEAALMSAAATAVKDICAKSKDYKQSADKVIPSVKYDDKNIAEFVFKIPDNPADETTKALGKGVENLEATQKEYKEAVDSVVENHESVDKALQAVQKKLEDSQKKGGDGQAKFDLSDELKELNRETGELETALKDARKTSGSLATDLNDVKKKVDGSKGALKSNATIDKAGFDKLGKVLTEAQTTLKKQIPDQLTKLDGLVKSIKTQHEAITKLGGRDKPPPKAEDLKKAKDALGSVGKDFQSEKANLAKLKLPDGTDKLKSLVDNLKS